MVMKNIPMGITYASFAGLTIIATVVVGVIRFNQVPNFYSIVGLVLIIIGVLMVNLLGKIRYTLNLILPRRSGPLRNIISS